jgi:hypothetical protein
VWDAQARSRPRLKDAGSSDLQAKSTLPIPHPDELLARVFGVVFAVAVVGLGVRSIGRLGAGMP